MAKAVLFSLLPVCTITVTVHCKTNAKVNFILVVIFLDFSCLVKTGTNVGLFKSVAKGGRVCVFFLQQPESRHHFTKRLSNLARFQVVPQILA